MNKQNGIVANWNEEKGFGFIDPQAGNRLIFAHISDYSKGHQKPFKGLEVQYLLSTDQRGRKRAVEVSPLTGYSKYSRGVKLKLFSFVLLIAFSGVLFFLFHSQRIPLSAFSAISFIVALISSAAVATISVFVDDCSIAVATLSRLALISSDAEGTLVERCDVSSALESNSLDICESCVELAPTLVEFSAICLIIP